MERADHAVQGRGDAVAVRDAGGAVIFKENPLFRGVFAVNTIAIPVWEKYTLTIDEAAVYFRIGENKLRKLAEENRAAGWVLMNGNRIQIKRKQFEKILDTLALI